MDKTLSDAEINALRADIARDLEAKLRDKLEWLDKERRFTRLMIWLLWAFGIPAIICLYAILAFPALPFQSKMEFTALVTIPATAGIFVAHKALVKSYSRMTKRKLMIALADAVGLKFHPNGVFQLGDIYDHLLLPSYDIRNVEDGFEGIVGGRHVKFQQATLHAKHVDIDRGKWFDFGTMFKGVVILIPLQKRLDFHTLIMPRAVLDKPAAFNADMRFLPFQPVNLVSRKFQDHYQVYSTNPVEGHYIFAPDFVEKLIELKDMVKARAISASFFESTMAMTIEFEHDVFEIGNLNTPLDALSLKDAIDEIAMIGRAVEVLNMTPHTGL